jgi:SAM-dependent methyltransferase
MTERYDRSAAAHYAAFRPPLHSLILDRVLRPGETFRTGLDVGCGTGYSTLALARYCDAVLGVDASHEMLNSARAHPKITYAHGAADALSQLPVRTFEIITFAGSLFYTKNEGLRQELLRVCPPGGSVVVYDFEVLLDEVMTGVGVSPARVASDYDYLADLSGWSEFAVVAKGAEKIRLEVTSAQLTHVLLADSNRYDALSGLFPNRDLFKSVVDLVDRSSGRSHLQAQIYFTRYQVGSEPESE